MWLNISMGHSLPSCGRDKHEWDLQVSLGLLAICSIPNRAIGFSSFELVYVQNLRISLDLLVEQVDLPVEVSLDARQFVEDLQKNCFAVG